MNFQILMMEFVVFVIFVLFFPFNALLSFNKTQYYMLAKGMHIVWLYFYINTADYVIFYALYIVISLYW